MTPEAHPGAIRGRGQAAHRRFAGARTRRRATAPWLFALLVSVLGGCCASAQGVSEPEHRLLRPAPLMISARAEGGAVRLSWGEAETRPGRVVVGYRIERFDETGARGMVAERDVNAFVDPAPPKGRLTYAVTALSAGGRALDRSTVVVVAP